MKTILPFLLLVAASALASDLPEHIRSCADCHGDKGVSRESDVPTIAGASETYIADTLFAYQEGTRIAIESKYRTGDTSRPATDMRKLSEELSEQQIADIARYFATQAFVAAKQAFDPALAAKGAKIHDLMCARCHSDGGASADDDAGILAGQWTPYLKQSFDLYLSGKRTIVPKMKVKLEQLDSTKVEALLHYYASQQ
jgi:cytochrome subunit of sulfide dehydrogenase